MPSRCAVFSKGLLPNQQTPLAPGRWALDSSFFIQYLGKFKENSAKLFRFVKFLSMNPLASYTPANTGIQGHVPLVTSPLLSPEEFCGN